MITEGTTKGVTKGVTEGTTKGTIEDMDNNTLYNMCKQSSADDMILISKPIIRRIITPNGLTPLLTAITFNNVKLVEVMLKSGYCNINERDNNKNTGLIIAAQQGNIEIVRLLLKYHCEPYAYNTNKYNAMTMAIKHKHIPIIQELAISGDPLSNPKGDPISKFYVDNVSLLTYVSEIQPLDVELFKAVLSIDYNQDENVLEKIKHMANTSDIVVDERKYNDMCMMRDIIELSLWPKPSHLYDSETVDEKQLLRYTFMWFDEIETLGFFTTFLSNAQSRFKILDINNNTYILNACRFIGRMCHITKFINMMRLYSLYNIMIVLVMIIHKNTYDVIYTNRDFSRISSTISIDVLNTLEIELLKLLYFRVSSYLITDVNDVNN